MSEQFFDIDPEISPTDNLRNYLWDLEQAYDGRWNESEEPVITLVNELERLAKDLLASGRRFAPQGQISTLAVAERFIPLEEKDRASLLKNDIAVNAIELALLKEAGERIHVFKERLGALIGIVRAFPFDGFTQRYLEEMSRLYLDGHDNAVYITARAALEESIREIIEQEHLEEEAWAYARESRPSDAKKERSSGLPDLYLLIRYATHQSRLIPRALRDQADAIRELGNDAVHQRENLFEKSKNNPPIQVIRSLSAILKSLAQWKK
jgi:hypothetical protein